MTSLCTKNAHLLTTKLLSESLENRDAFDFILRRTKEIEAKRAANTVLKKATDPVSKQQFVQNIEDIARAKRDVDAFNLATVLQDRASLDSFADSLQKQGFTESANILKFVNGFDLGYDTYMKQPENNIFRVAMQAIHGKPVTGRDFKKLVDNLREITIKRFAFNFSSKKNGGIFPTDSSMKDEVNKFFQGGIDVFDEFRSVDDVVQQMKKDVSSIKPDKTLDDLIDDVQRVEGVDNLEQFIYNNLQNIFARSNDTKSIAAFVNAYNDSLRRAIDGGVAPEYSRLTTLFQNFARVLENGVTSEPAAMQYAFGMSALQRLGIQVDPVLFGRGRAKKFSYIQGAKRFVDDLLMHTKQYLQNQDFKFRSKGGIAPSLKSYIDPKSDIPLRQQFEEKMGEILQILGGDSELITDARVLNRLKELALGDPTMKNIMDGVDSLLIAKLGDNVTIDKLAGEFASIKDDITELINSNIEGLQKEVGPKRTNRDVIRYVLDNPLMGDEGAVFFDAQRLSKDPVNRASQLLSEQGFRYGVKLPGVAEAAYTQDTAKKLIDDIKKGKVKSVILQNEFSVDKMGDVYKTIKDYNLDKDEVDRIRLVYPTGKQTFSFFYDDTLGLTVRTQNKRDAMQLQSNIKQLGVEFDELDQAEVGELYEEYFAKKLDAEFDGDVDLARTAFAEEFGDITQNEAKRRMSYVYSVSDYKVSQELVNTQVERIKIALWDEINVRHEAERVIQEMGVFGARGQDGIASINLDNFAITNRPKLNDLIFAMNNSQSVQEKLTLRKAFLEETGVLEKHSGLEFDSNIHVLEDAVATMEREAIGVPVYFGTNKVLNWMADNKETIDGLLATGQGLAKVPSDVKTFIHKYIAKNKNRYGGPNYRQNLTINMGSAMADINRYIDQSAAKSYNIESDVDKILEKYSKFKRFEFLIKDNTDKVFDRYMKSILEPMNVSDERAVLKTFKKQDEEIFSILDNYRKIADNVTTETPYRDVLDLKRKFVELVDDYEQKLLKRYKGVIHSSEFSSRKSNVFIIDRVSQKDDFFSAIDNLEESYKGLLDDINDKKIALEKKADTEEIATDKYAMLLDEEKGYYTTVVEGEVVTVSLDDELRAVLDKIPDGTSEQIDALKLIDLSYLNQSQKATMFKVSKMVESALFDNVRDVVGGFRARLMPVLGEFYTRYSEIVVKANQDNVIKRDFGEFGLPEELAGRDHLKVVFDDLGEDSSRSLDLLIKRKVYEEVSNNVRQAKDFDLKKIVDSNVNKVLKDYVDGPIGGRILGSSKLNTFKDSLIVDFRPYEAIITLDIPEETIDGLKKDLDRRSTINQFITEADRQILKDIEITTNAGTINMQNYFIRSSDEVIDDVRYLSTGNDIQPVEAAKVELKKTKDAEVVSQSHEYTQAQVLDAQEIEAKARRLLNAGDVRATMKKTTNFSRVFDNVVQPLIEMAFKEEGSPLIAFRKLNTMSVEDQKLFRSYYKDQVNAVYVPLEDASLPEKFAADVYRYLETWKLGMLDAIEIDEVDEAVRNIHLALTKKQDYEHLESLVKDNRVFEWIALSDSKLKPKMFSDYKMTANPKLAEEKYAFWREAFVREDERKLVKDKDIQLIYDTYASRGYTSRLKRFLSMQYNGDNKLLKYLSVSLGTIPKGLEWVLGGTARAILQIPGYVGPIIYDKLLQQKDLSSMKAIYDEIDWGAAAGPTVSNVFKFRADDSFIQKADKIFDTFLKETDNPQVIALREELGGGLNQLVDIIFRGYVKDKSFYDALKSIPTAHTENAEKFLDFVKNAPDSQYKRDLINKVKQTATRNFDINTGYHLSRGFERQKRGWRALLWDLVDFRGSWGRMMVSNFFSELFSPIVAVGGVWTDVASNMIRGQYKGIGGFNTAMADGFVATRQILGNNLEFHTAWTTLIRNAYWSNKISRLVSEDYADPDREESVYDEFLDILKALKWFYTPAVALDTSYAGRTLQTYMSGIAGGDVGRAAFDNLNSFIRSMGRQLRGFNAINVLMKQFSEGEAMSWDTVQGLFNQVGGGAFNYYSDYSEGYYGESVIPMSKFGLLSMLLGDNIGSPKETMYDISSDNAYQKFLGLFSPKETPEEGAEYLKDYVLFDIGYKLPVINTAIRIWRGSSSISEGTFEELESLSQNDLVYQTMVKEGTIDIDLMRKKFVALGKPGAYQRMLNIFDDKVDGYSTAPGKGNFAKTFEKLDTVEGVNSVVFNSFVRALDGEGSAQAFYEEMLNVTGSKRDRGIREIMEVLHVARGTGDLDEDAFIGASKVLMGYVYDIQKQAYTSEFAAENKAAGLSGAKSKISELQKQIVKERALQDVGKYLPSADMHEGLDLFAEYLREAYPEASKFLQVTESDFAEGGVDVGFAGVWARSMATEYMYDQCLSQGRVDCIGQYKNMYSNVGSFLPREELIQVQLVNNAFDKIDESPDMSFYDKMLAKGSIILNNRELLDIAEDLKEGASSEDMEIIDGAVSRWFGTLKGLTDISEKKIEMNDSDKAKGNGSFKGLGKVKVEGLNKILKPLKNIVNSRTDLFDPKLIKDVRSSNPTRYFPKTKWNIMRGAMKRVQNTGAATAAKSESFIKGKSKAASSGRRGTKIRKVKKQRKPKLKKSATGK